MQQHLMQMQPMMASYYPNNVTTDHIQQYLDENKSLILKIVESQNSGKLSECAENQAKLQRNLMYLAAIADSQPQPPTMHPQACYGAASHYMQQHHQAQAMTPQSLMAARSSMLYAQQSPFSALQQHQAAATAFHGQLSMSSGGGGSGLGLLHSESSHSGGGGGGGGGGFPDFGRGEGGLAGGNGRMLGGGSKHEMGSSSSAEGRGVSSGSGDGGETLYLKSTDGGN
ncbi:hypothetical protein SAY86_010053 [Trapa natans]|uniref:SS18 N-terminal domain-containing protein n=1 Tax=Trapa natans TaxID=22666 RepID=A0AAN7L2U2_TRANT|nr:hypothetical protein SAY86_010053 [Trapa natans]